jgi:N-acetylglutamate synthase/N-acetylornithine aminotransferase
MSIADTPVTYPIPPLPRGWRMAAVHAGIKRNASREDVTLVASDRPATAAGVYTTNLVFAAPVALDRSRTPGTGFRGVVINSGNGLIDLTNAGNNFRGITGLTNNGDNNIALQTAGALALNGAPLMST